MCVRRHAVCVALALVCIGVISASAAWGVYQRDFVQPEDFASGYRDQINFQPEQGGLVLNECSVCSPFLWVPSLQGNFVSRIDARTGMETARYQMGPSDEDWAPCSVAVDNLGNAWVACICPDSTGKIVKISANTSTDGNGDGVVNTCADYNGNKQVSTTEMLPWGTDDLVGPVIEVGSARSCPSSIIF